MAKPTNRPPHGKRVQISFKNVPAEGRLCQQSDMPLTSIRKLIKQGVALPSPEDAGAVYGDFSDAQQFQDMMDTVVKAQEAFDMLPATVRDRFDNNPKELIAFVNDEDNLDEAIEMGLIDQETAFKKQTEVNQTEVEKTGSQTKSKSKTGSQMKAKASSEGLLGEALGEALEET